MSTHPCAWASNVGRDLKLSCPERVTLWQLAERAATKGFCFPSLSQLITDTGLAKATLVSVVRRLAALALIRIEKDGQRHIYHVLMPVQNKTDRSKSEPVNRSKSEPVGPDADRFKNVARPVQKRAKTGSKLNPNLKRTRKEPYAREAHVAVAAPDGRAVAALPVEQHEAPTTAREPPDTAPPDATSDGVTEAKAWMSQKLGRTVHLAVPPAEVVTEDTRPQTEEDRQRIAAVMAAQTAALEAEFRERADRLRYGDRQPFTPEEQTDICAGIPRVKPYFLPPELLRAHRAALAARFPDA